MALKDRQLQNFHILVRKQFDIFRKEDVHQPNPGKINTIPPSLFDRNYILYDRITYQPTRKVCGGDLAGERRQQQQQFTQGPYIFCRRPTMRREGGCAISS